MPTQRASTKKKSDQLPMFQFEEPSMPELDRKRSEVKEISSETAGKMVEEFHYAHAVPSIMIAYGLYVDDVLAGCITFGVSANKNLDELCGPEHAGHVLELNRLFIHDWAGRNSESYLIGKALDKMRKEHPDFYILVSYADSAHGHKGMVYQATNWIYTGESVMGIEGWMHEGKRYHPRTLSSMFGSCAAEVVLANLPGAEPIHGEVKYRYVYLLGDKTLHKELVAALKFPKLPYPKEVAESLYDENGNKKAQPKKSKPPASTITDSGVPIVKACCLAAAPLDCLTCLAIICPRHGEQHSAECPNHKEVANEPAPTTG